MLISDRTAFAKKPIGALVTLDKVFELVEGNLSNEKRTDIHQISERSRRPRRPPLGIAYCEGDLLLEFIRDLPGTEANLAAVLVDEVGKATPLERIRKRMEAIERSTIRRNTEEGWKLRTPREKNWRPNAGDTLNPRT